MAKNIVLCADGTGNKGGYTPDSNVYKMYHAVDIHDADNPQTIYYDNGVGTAKNKFMRALGGAVGFGFGANVRDLYQYLARKYEPGDRLSGGSSSPDKVYVFGFSRGAATIRAFMGFVYACGLVDGRGLSNDDLTARVDAEFKKYRALKGAEPTTPPAAVEGQSHGVIDIQFLGVWDTVSALGFPERTDITSLGMWALNALFVFLGWLTDKVPYFAHRFYSYQLTDNVQFAYQALALDDARTAFRPWVWDEHGRTPDTVEQVWFAGMHSNVGGGYNRSGLANVTLEWMMERASRHGLMLREDKMNAVSADAHVHGRLYDSRDGLAMFYRYHPRELAELCHREKPCCAKKQCDETRPFAVLQDALKNNPPPKRSCNKLLGEIKIHNSVIERMCKRTANYAPTQLPDTFEVVETDMNIPGSIVNPAANDPWATEQATTHRWIFGRKWLYGLMLESTLAITVLAFYFWVTLPDPMSCEKGTGLLGDIADILNYLLPDMFCGLISVVVLQNSQFLWAAIVAMVIYFLVRSYARHQTVNAAERLRRLVMNAVNS
jgi:uncharacterized protein (DUF2235 family)